MMANIVVIGAGVVGLLTASRIQLALPDARVKVIADKPYSETCWFGSGGGFSMTIFKDSTMKEEELQRKLNTGHFVVESGAIICMGFDLWSEDSKGADIDHTWARLRPGRRMIRVEKETMDFNNGQLKVVHNYGHHSNGVGFSWDTSNDANDWVLQSLNRNA